MPRAAMSVATSTRDLRRCGTPRAPARAHSAPCCRGWRRRRCRPASDAWQTLVGAVLGAGEDQHAIHARGSASSSASRSRLSPAPTKIHALIDALDRGRGRRDVDAHRDRRASRRRAWRSSGGMVAENSSVWRSLAAACATIFRTSRMKPMSSMRSASSRTKIDDLVELDVALVDRGRAAGRAWRRGCRRRAAAPSPACSGRRRRRSRRSARLRLAAIGARSCRRSGRPARGSARASRHAGSPACAARRCSAQALQDRQREGRGLAGAGLGDAEQIPALGEQRNGLRLDRRRFEVVFGLERKPQRLGQAEAVERSRCHL